MKKKYTFLKFIPMILIMIAIFCFSQQNGAESTGVSNSVIEMIKKLRLDLLLPESLANNTVILTKLVRKGAHFSEYALLGWFTVFAFKSFIRSKWAACIFSEVLVILYASSDEFHQWFIPGRSSSVIDVCIDSLGALFGIWLFMFFAIVADFIRRKKKQKLHKND